MCAAGRCCGVIGSVAECLYVSTSSNIYYIDDISDDVNSVYFHTSSVVDKSIATSSVSHNDSVNSSSHSGSSSSSGSTGNIEDIEGEVVEKKLGVGVGAGEIVLGTVSSLPRRLQREYIDLGRKELELLDSRVTSDSTTFSSKKNEKDSFNGTFWGVGSLNRMVVFLKSRSVISSLLFNTKYFATY